MAKKDKKIEIQLTDALVDVNGNQVEGSQLIIGKRVVGDIVELDSKFAVIKDAQVDTFYKTLDQAMAAIIEDYNLHH
ncbi:DUF2969 domain-containing protein [Streptococcus sp. zg-JUN1979]|uniref:DUF2969 domain-containing protein n=1 Tax=Streptococcus sp. zg-JUN1979 TaxID=3391450 RepID=UPI0039A47BB8